MTTKEEDTMSIIVNPAATSDTGARMTFEQQDDKQDTQDDYEVIMVSDEEALSPKLETCNQETGAVDVPESPAVVDQGAEAIIVEPNQPQMEENQDKAPVQFRLCWVGPNVHVKWFVLILLVMQSTVMVLLTRYSRARGDASTRYVSSTAIVIGEIVKAIIAFGALRLDGAHLSFREVIADVQTEIFHRDMVKMSVPGFLYMGQNNLLFLALTNLDAAVYQVTAQLKILTTALLSVWMLGRRLHTNQIVALVLLTSGVAMVQFGEMGGSSSSDESGAKGNTLLGLACVITACFSSAFAGVYLEQVFKKERVVSLWIRNIQLGMFGTIFGLVTIFISPHDREVVLRDGFFHGYDWVVAMVVLVHAAGGLLVAAVIQYGDNILKGFATSVSIVLSVVCSVWLFSFSISVYFLVGAFLVVVAVVLYGMEPSKRDQEPTYTPLPTDASTGTSASATLEKV